MADVDAVIRWTGAGLSFDATSGSQTIRLDGAAKEGPNPVQALLLSLGACTAADVVDILTKMRVPFETVELRAEADRAPSPPRRFTAVRLTYVARGLAEDDVDKLQRAVQLSHEKYCSVMHSLREDIEIRTDISLG